MLLFKTSFFCNLSYTLGNGGRSGISGILVIMIFDKRVLLLQIAGGLNYFTCFLTITSLRGKDKKIEMDKMPITKRS